MFGPPTCIYCSIIIAGSPWGKCLERFPLLPLCFLMWQHEVCLFLFWDNDTVSGRCQWPSSSQPPSDEPKKIWCDAPPNFCCLCPNQNTDSLVLIHCPSRSLLFSLQWEGFDSSLVGSWQGYFEKRIVASCSIILATLTMVFCVTHHLTSSHKSLSAKLSKVHLKIRSANSCIRFLFGSIGWAPQRSWTQ